MKDLEIKKLTESDIIKHEISNFLTKEECDYLIELGNTAKLHAGTISTPSGRIQDDDYRIALTTTLPRNDVVEGLRKRVANLLELDYLNSEGVVFIKYPIGGIFKVHNDFFYHHSPEMTELLSRGLNRVKTAIIYLNDDFEGGITFFPHFDKEIKPETGKLVSWLNGDPNGIPYEESQHGSTIITEGTKYIVTFWMHQGNVESARPQDLIVKAASRNNSKKYE
jgi:prolyl 4-hydroxylase